MAKSSKSRLPPSPEALAELRRVIESCAEPKTAAELAKVLAEPHRLTPAQLAPTLEAQVAAGLLRTYPPTTAKGKPRYWDRDLATSLRSAILEVMQRVDGPLTAKELAGRVVEPPRFTEIDAAPILDEFVAAGTLHRFPPKGKAKSARPRFWNRDQREVGRLELHKLLSAKGPQTQAQLRKGVKSLDDGQFEQLVNDLLASRGLFLHPALKPAGQPLLGSRPPAILPYLKDVTASLNKVVGRLLEANVSRDDLRRALVQLIEAAGISFGGAKPDRTAEFAAAPSPEVDLVSLMRQIEPGADRGALIGAAELRRVARLGKEEFDRAAIELARRGRISLHRHDYASSLTPEQRDDLVTDGAGAYFVGMAIRQSGG